MKNLVILAVAFVAVLAVIMYRSSKSPAAEDREAMDRIAKRVADSIHTGLDSALGDPAREFGGVLPSSTLQPVPVPAPAPANGQPAAPTATPANK